MAFLFCISELYKKMTANNIKIMMIMPAKNIMQPVLSYKVMAIPFFTNSCFNCPGF